MLKHLLERIQELSKVHPDFKKKQCKRCKGFYLKKFKKCPNCGYSVNKKK